MSDLSVFEHVLFIGPDYRAHKGGIGAVLSVYADNISGFNFIATQRSSRSAFGNLVCFAGTMAKLCWQLLRNRRIRIIHIHGASKSSFYRKYCVFLVAKYLFGKMVIYHAHGGKFHLFYENGSPRVRKNIRHFMTSADYVICLSRQWKNFFIHSFGIKSLSIINNPVPVQAPPYPAAADGRRLSLLFLGKIGDNKGIFDLLDVLAANRELYQHAIKLRVGGNGEVNRLKDYIITRQLTGMVEYAGWVEGDLKTHLLSSCDVLLLPSYNEGLPVSLLEAMSFGKPVVATRVGGIPEIVKDGVNGFLMHPGDKAALKDHIDYLLGHTAERKKMGVRSLEIVAPYYIGNVLEELKVLYMDLLKTSGQ